VSLFNQSPEQRRTLRNWVFVGFGPVATILLAGIIAALVFAFRAGELQRIHWLGWIGMALCSLLCLIIVVFGMETGLRTLKLKAGKGGVQIEAGDDGVPQ
jgi:MFS family permease